MILLFAKPQGGNIMIVEYILKSIEPSEVDNRPFKLSSIDSCPICKKSIAPKFLNGIFWITDENDAHIECHFMCPGCKRTFIGSYLAESNYMDYDIGEIISIDPQHYESQHFDSHIEDLSPQFIKIFNQSLAAESYGLDEIAGLGYRKSLEFLVKDFAIHRYPGEEEEIKKLMLSPCIKKYIDNPQIKTLAERSAWIGNDEAHYIRKQANRDVSDMKSFIQATVYFISMILITEDAESMDPAK